MKDLGLSTNAEVLSRFLDVANQNVVDVGCGDLTFSRVLRDAGAKVLAIDPDPIQAARNRALADVPGLRFVEAGGDAIPSDDGSLDGVFFSYSLHHVPESAYSQVFREVRRVLKPGGFLYVIEPTDCPLNHVMRLFHDEDAERAAAQEALHRLARPYFQEVESVAYHSLVEFATFDAFAEHFTSRTFNSLYTDADVRRQEVREAYERTVDSDSQFQSSKLVVVMRGFHDQAGSI